MRGKELPVRKVRADHQQHVAVHHGVIAGRKPEQAGPAHVERVVILDVLLATQRMHDRRFERTRECDQLRMRSGTARTAKDGDLLRRVEQLRQCGNFVLGRTHAWCRLRKMPPPLFDGSAQGHVSGQGNHRNAAARAGGLYGDLQDSGHLLGLGHQFTIVATLRKQMFRVGFLKISAADFMAGNLRRDSEDGHPAAVTVVEAVDQMEIPGTAAAGADR
jgi:hypothetical protein